MCLYLSLSICIYLCLPVIICIYLCIYSIWYILCCNWRGCLDFHAKFLDFHGRFLVFHVQTSVYAFICIHLYSSVCFSIYLYLSVSICIYLYLSVYICIHLYPSVSIRIYLYLPVSIRVYLYLFNTFILCSDQVVDALIFMVDSSIFFVDVPMRSHYYESRTHHATQSHPYRQRYTVRGLRLFSPAVPSQSGPQAWIHVKRDTYLYSLSHICTPSYECWQDTPIVYMNKILYVCECDRHVFSQVHSKSYVCPRHTCDIFFDSKKTLAKTQMQYLMYVNETLACLLYI